MTDQKEIPLLVSADLATGIAQAAPWGIALDGLLASQMWAEEKAALSDLGEPAPDVRADSYPPDLDLPLARCRLPVHPDCWHWACTCAYPLQRVDDIDVHYWTGRADHRSLEVMTESLPAVLSDRQGRYRARRMPLLVTPCRTLTWRAVGDPEAIDRLLAGIISLGKKRSHGEGQVLKWRVEPIEVDKFTAGHLHPDKTLGRPTPPECLHGLADVADGGEGTAGIRAPYMHASRQHPVRLPALWD